MRLSELLGCTVHDLDGGSLGTVTDVAMVPTGRSSRSTGTLAVESLLISPRHTGSLFGYERREEQGPWLIAAIIRRLHRGAFRVAWRDVTEWDQQRHRVILARGHRRHAASIYPS